MNVKHAAKKVAERLPASLRRTAARKYQNWTKPLVSIVVPVYNVEIYIGECLDSLLAQTYTNFEVIVVDDGSPDGSGAIAAEYAKRDRRVKVLRQDNTGLGGARNNGAALARGEFLWFVDSDDTAPPTALASMANSLIASGSDLVVGSLTQMTGYHKTVPPWAQRVHSTELIATNLNEHPEVLKNVFAWSKLFRTDYFREHVGPFPSGLYEDQVPSTRAYANGTFDVITEVIINWRQRGDTSSITQQKTSTRDLEERWAALEGVAEALTSVDREIQEDWQAKVIGFDMRPYYLAAPRASDEYWEILHQHTRAFLDNHGVQVLDRVPAIDRLAAAAAYHGYRDDLAELAIRRETMTWNLPGEVSAGVVRLRSEYFDGLQLTSQDVSDDLTDEVVVVQCVTTLSITDSAVGIEGFVYLSSVDLSRGDAEIAIAAITDTGERVKATVEIRDSLEAQQTARDPWNSHLRSGFVASLPVAALVADAYRLEVSVETNGLVRDSSLQRPRLESGASLPTFGPMDVAGRWSLGDTQDIVLEKVSADRVPVDGAEVDGEVVRLHLPQGDTQLAGVMRASSAQGNVRGRWDPTSGWAEFVLPRRTGTAATQRWWFTYQPAGTKVRLHLAWYGSELTLEPQPPAGILVSADAQGSIIAETAARVGEITSLTVEDGVLNVAGWLDYAQKPQATPVLALATADRALISQVTIERTDGRRFTGSLPMFDASGTALSKSRGYALVIRDDDGEYWPRASRELARTIPTRLTDRTQAVDLSLTPKARSLWLRFAALFSGEERSRYGQDSLTKAYLSAPPALKNAALFESFAGAAVGDSPLGISKSLSQSHPDIDQVWTVDCLSREVPPYATAVLRYSSEWYAALATSRWLVNNNNWPYFFQKKPGQTYVQTWHGTPLKRIGKHVPAGNLSLSYRKLMQREASEWDFLLAQNDFAADILPEALQYSGETLTEGYPRNDSLVNAAATQRRKEIRELLGLKDTDFALLYAPTWRDNLKGVGGYGRVSFLDTEVLSATPQGDADRVVLYRGHSNTTGGPATQPTGFIDVTTYGNVNDLMLAADCLVTDYSSIMFDFAVTEKPIYFLVPDLDTYGDVTRGFYLDLNEIAPGPLCATTDDLIGALDGDYWRDWSDRYSAFQARFTSRDDGDASARVVSHIFPPPGA